MRHDDADGPSSGADALTGHGECLLPVLDAMREYGTRLLVDAPAELSGAPGSQEANR